MKTYTTSAGHTFTFTQTEPYIRKDSTATSLDVWSSPCRHPSCENWVTVKIPHGATPGPQLKAFAMAHCPDHRLSKAEATNRWVAACTKTNTRTTPEMLAAIAQLLADGLSPKNISLIVPLSTTRIYELVKIHKLKRK